MVQAASEAPAADAPAPSSAAAASEESDEVPSLLPGEQSFALVIPEGAEPGMRLQISLPGIEKKIIVTVPEGAVVGKSINFNMQGLPDAKQSEAAVIIQALHRGKQWRQRVAAGYSPRGHAAPPHLPSAAPAASANGKQPAFNPANYPSLPPPAESTAEAPAPSDAASPSSSAAASSSAASSSAAASTSAAAPDMPRRALYTPRGAAAACAPSNTPPAATTRKSHDASLYPTVDVASGDVASGVHATINSRRSASRRSKEDANILMQGSEEPPPNPSAPRYGYTPRGAAASLAPPSTNVTAVAVGETVKSAKGVAMSAKSSASSSKSSAGAATSPEAPAPNQETSPLEGVIAVGTAIGDGLGGAMQKMASLTGFSPPPAALPPSAPVDLRVGARVMAVAPGEEPDEPDARWVPGRVLSQRTHVGAKQFKISLDGYDSEDDQWVESDDPRVRPYDAPVAGGSADDDDALKEAAKKEAAEKDEARRFNELRKGQARSAYELAGADAKEAPNGEA